MLQEQNQTQHLKPQLTIDRAPKIGKVVLIEKKL